MVLQALYAAEHGEVDPDDAFDQIALGEEKLSPKNMEFARALVRAVSNNIAKTDEQITRLADNWDTDRIAALDRTILRMAIVELQTMPDTPVKVVLNEAIELAKKFSTMESSKFVNGILDNFVKGMTEE